MAISMRMRWDGVTSDQYDRVRELVGWERDHPTGGILHEAWFVGDQLNVCDIWDSTEDFDQFVQHRLMPGVAQIGLSGQPDVQISPLYHYQLEKPLSAGAVIEEDELPVEAYMALETKVGWRDVPPIGGISHVATVDGPVVRLVTAWENPADREAFGADRIGPAAVELGFPAPPETAPLYPLYALFDGAGVLAAH